MQKRLELRPITWRAACALALTGLLAACGGEAGPSGASMAGDWAYAVTAATAADGEACDVTGLSLLIIDGNDAAGDFAGSVVATTENNIVCHTEAGGTTTLDIDGSALMMGVLQTGTSVQFVLPNPFPLGPNWNHTGTMSANGQTMSGAVTMYLNDNDALEGSWTATRK